MVDPLAKLHREMSEHPARFDFADLPEPGLSEAQKAQSDRMRPDWLKALSGKGTGA